MSLINPLAYPPAEVTVNQKESAVDLFGRLYSAAPFTIFDSKQIFNSASLFWDNDQISGVGGSSVYQSLESLTRVRNAGDQVGLFARQTFMRHNYQPGKEYGLFMTGVIREGDNIDGETGLGLIDDNNGLAFVDTNATTVSVRVRSNTTGSVVDTDIPQASWNVDTMDGNGPSGITVDWTKPQVFFIRFGWLGYNDPEFGLVIDSKLRVVHKVLVANTSVSRSPYMRTPNLPLRAWAESAGTGGALTDVSVALTCAEIHASGGQQPYGVYHYASTAQNTIICTTVGTIYALIGIRLQTAYIGLAVDIIKASLSVQSANDGIEWLLLFNPTVAGTFTYSNHPNSGVQIAIGSTANTVTGGIPFTGDFLATGNSGNGDVSTSNAIANAIRLGAAIDGTLDQIVLCARPVVGASAEVLAGLTWRELD